MNKLDKLAKALVESQERKADTSPYDTTATVTRIEGDTAWVHIPGGVDETPVKLTISAGKGDTVQVRVSGGTAYIIGNSSRPPTDDRVANVAKAKADTAQATADDAVKSASVATTKAVFAQETADGAQETAQDAHKIAADTAQYFWVTETGTDTGAHITEVSQEAFVNNPSGGNLLARSNGIAVRDGLTELATFGADGVMLGKDGEQRTQQTSAGLNFIDENGIYTAKVSVDSNQCTIYNSYSTNQIVVGNSISLTRDGLDGLIVNGEYVYLTLYSDEDLYTAINALGWTSDVIE